MKKTSLLTFFVLTLTMSSAHAQFECEAYLESIGYLSVEAKVEDLRQESEHIYDSVSQLYAGHTGTAYLENKTINLQILFPKGDSREIKQQNFQNVSFLPVGTEITFTLGRFLDVRSSELEWCECKHEIDRSQHMTTTKWYCEAS